MKVRKMFRNRRKSFEKLCKIDRTNVKEWKTSKNLRIDKKENFY